MKYLFILSASLLLSACNTMQGMGEDIQQGGKAISNSASKAKQELDAPVQPDPGPFSTSEPN